MQPNFNVLAHLLLWSQKTSTMEPDLICNDIDLVYILRQGNKLATNEHICYVYQLELATQLLCTAKGQYFCVINIFGPHLVH